MNHFISIQAAAGEYGISTRWIWKSIRVDRTLGAVVRNGRVYLRRIEWHLSNGIPDLSKSGTIYMRTCNPAISGSEKERKVRRTLSYRPYICFKGYVQ